MNSDACPTQHIRQRALLAIAVSLFAMGEASGNPDKIIDIWPDRPPGDERILEVERDMTEESDPLIAGRRIMKLGNVTVPQAHVYLPAEAVRTGSAVVVCPGGGFTILAWDLEGTEVAEWLNSLGVAAIVLKYRVPTRDQNPMWMAGAQDTQRTVSLARYHSEDWQLDPSKIAVLGFSAGGAAALRASLAFGRYYDPVDAADAEDCRADRTILIYAGGLPEDEKDESDGNEARFERVTAQSPPVFMAHAFDDFVPVEGTARLMLKLKRAGVPSELHIYDAGGHGYGLRQRDDLPVTTWTKPCEAWLRRAQWIR